MKMFNKIAGVVVLSGTLVLMGCGKDNGGTVTLKSAAFSQAAVGARTARTVGNPWAGAVAPVTQLSFCVTKLKLEAEDGHAVKHSDDDDDLLEVRLGLINLNDGSQPITWGKADLPTGKPVKRIKVELHRDASLCGVDYSIMLNGQKITKDVELKFAFAQAATINADSSITFDLRVIADRLSLAFNNNLFNDQFIENELQGLEGEIKHD